MSTVTIQYLWKDYKGGWYLIVPFNMEGKFLQVSENNSRRCGYILQIVFNRMKEITSMSNYVVQRVLRQERKG